jgi:transposase
MGPVQEHKYRLALERAGLLEGDPNQLPKLEQLKAAVLEHEPPKPAPQQASSVERWASEIERMLSKGARPTAIFDKLRLDESEFTGSLRAVKRLCRRLMKAKGVRAEDVAIPVITAPGEVAQVDFGYVGRLFDPTNGRLRRAWVFVMVLGHSRHQLLAPVLFRERSQQQI